MLSRVIICLFILVATIFAASMLVNHSIFTHSRYLTIICGVISTLVFPFILLSLLFFNRNLTTIALSMGGEELLLETINYKQKKIVLKVIEILSLDWNITIPQIYVIPESGINACSIAKKNEAIIIITKGAVDTLNEEELKILLTYEFYNIVSKKSILNLYVIIFTKGFTLFFTLFFTFTKKIMRMS